VETGNSLAVTSAAIILFGKILLTTINQYAGVVM
jgi:hypothetical protein